MAQLDARLEVSAGQVAAGEASIERDRELLDALSRELTELRETGRIDEYNGKVADFNDRAAAYNDRVRAQRQLVADHNRLVEERNAIAAAYTALAAEIDTSAETVPGA